jgi:antirestriction protein ArdC
MPSQSEIQKQITDRILEGLKAGCIPWRKTWRAGSKKGQNGSEENSTAGLGC